LRAAFATPGIHLRELARLLDVSLHSVRYHVDLLSSSGQIICDKTSKYSRIFPPGTQEIDIAAYSLLRNNSARKVLSALCSMNNLNNKEISEITGLAKSTVSEITQKLVEIHLVGMELSDNGIRIGLRDPARAIKLLQQVGAAKTSVVDSFIDIWEL
jgi:predicted transcriptional regulator